MGNHLATTDIGQKEEGAAVPLSGGEERGGGAETHLTQCGWPEIYLGTKWHLDPCSRLATIDISHGGCALS